MVEAALKPCEGGSEFMGSWAENLEAYIFSISSTGELELKKRIVKNIESLESINQ